MNQENTNDDNREYSKVLYCTFDLFKELIKKEKYIVTEITEYDCVSYDAIEEKYKKRDPLNFNLTIDLTEKELSEIYGKIMSSGKVLKTIDGGYC